MDNYSLKEVKMLMNNNLVTPDVLKNILNSTTRRLELYHDKDDLEILKYLSRSSLVPSDTKEEIDKYLALYDSYNVMTHESEKESIEQRKGGIILIFSLILFLLVLCVLLFLNKG